jgi:hypothetical protein
MAEHHIGWLMLCNDVSVFIKIYKYKATSKNYFVTLHEVRFLKFEFEKFENRLLTSFIFHNELKKCMIDDL